MFFHQQFGNENDNQKIPQKCKIFTLIYTCRNYLSFVTLQNNKNICIFIDYFFITATLNNHKIHGPLERISIKRKKTIYFL